MKKGDVLRPLLFSFALGCAITKAEVNQEGRKLNGKQQLVV